ncbi:hypothetical protein NEHOM01_2237 [Nematocida homosporus]|uniref:uncharacterized protein n=1 Tax=Nematocida homosporus TaxID=1912981 RepID=UPI00221EB3C5|nr:uncharacterized protein NEHOM01_2237 [Nematocida homosporus]KAI5187516.1 hypothetical protein NEHOM01_2237 [Nematocida homosporus]
MASKTKYTVIVITILGTAAVLSAALFGYIVYQKWFYKKPSQLDSLLISQQNCLEELSNSHTSQQEDIEEFNSEPLSFNAILKNKSVSTIQGMMNVAVEMACGEEALSRCDDYITTRFMPSMVFGPPRGAGHLNTKAIRSFIERLRDRKNTKVNLVLTPSETYNLLWVKIIDSFAEPCVWLGHYLTTPELNCLKDEIEKYDQTDSTTWEDRRRQIARQFIHIIAARTKVGEFTIRCQQIHSKLVGYKKHRRLAPPDGSVDPVENMLFIIDFLTHLVPTTPKNRDKINTFLNETENTIAYLENDSDKVTTYDDYIAHFSKVVKSGITKAKDILTMLLSVYKFMGVIHQVIKFTLNLPCSNAIISCTSWRLPEPKQTFQTNQARINSLIQRYQAALPAWDDYINLIDNNLGQNVSDQDRGL